MKRKLNRRKQREQRKDDNSNEKQNKPPVARICTNDRGIERNPSGKVARGVAISRQQLFRRSFV
jgi:hypothetical protein